ncbi:hypothetical protein Bbelb_229280 [Branchiostoma belcheri]|nr:hypothetical protein Bbelb_229280 [Branchiostoma belcheri]
MATALMEKRTGTRMYVLVRDGPNATTKGVSRGRNLATEGVLAFSARATNSRPQDSSLCYPACFAQNAFSAPGHKYTLMLPHCVALGTPPRAQINKNSPTVLRCLYLIKRAWNKPNSSNSGGKHRECYYRRPDNQDICLQYLCYQTTA